MTTAGKAGEPARILLTGASGFVGRHMQRALAAAFPAASLLTQRVDIRDAGAVRGLVRETSPDVCVHLAAMAAIPDAQRDPDLAWAINLHGTLNIARVLLAEAPNCRMLYASSADAYGATFRRGSALNEDAPLAPMNTYGATKAAADLALGALARDGLRVVRMRTFNHTGAGQTTGFVVPAFARQVARIAAGLQDPVMSVGNLDSRRDFTDVRDICDAYVACIRAGTDVPDGTILNIASGEPRRIADILDDLIALAGVAVEIRPDPARMRAADLPVTQGDSSLARRLIGWTPRRTWNETLQSVMSDWQARVRADPAA
ncbi:MAG: GDP-mannose 4,6-dehydratase [Acetobacteraceae bacterium]